MASYVNNCILRGVIADKPRRSKDGAWRFAFEIQMSGAMLGARSDGGCKDHPKRIKVELNVEDEKAVFRKGQALWLRDLYKDNQGGKPFHIFTLMSEAEGKSSVGPDK